MPKFIIERDIPGAGKMTADDIQKASRKSNDTLNEMGPRIQWLESYVTNDKLYCVYIAPDADTVRRHATLSGFPADRVERVMHVIDPTSGE